MSLCGYLQQFDQHWNEGWFPTSGPPDWSLGFGPLAFYSLLFQGWAPTRHFPHWIINRKHTTSISTWPHISKNLPEAHIWRRFSLMFDCLFKALRRQAGKGKEHSVQFSSFTTSAINRFLLLTRVILCQWKISLT